MSFLAGINTAGWPSGLRRQFKALVFGRGFESHFSQVLFQNLMPVAEVFAMQPALCGNKASNTDSIVNPVHVIYSLHTIICRGSNFSI